MTGTRWINRAAGAGSGMCLWLAACATTQEPASSPPVPSIIASYVDAYNRQDMAAMTAMMHPDIQWLALEGDTVAVYADGREDLVAQLSGYMNSSNPTESRIDGWVADGGVVVVREVVRWTGSDGQERSQSALAVYEMADGLIRRVWYLPSTPGE